MNSENQHSNFINFRRYYTNEMSPEEKAAFEKNLENDPFAKDAYEGFLIYAKDFDKISAIEKTNMAFKEKVGIESSATLNLKPILAIAASVVVLLSAFYVVKNNFVIDDTLAKNEEIDQEKEMVQTNPEVEEQSMVFDSLIEDTMPETNEYEAENDIVIENVPEEKSSEVKSPRPENNKEKDLVATDQKRTEKKQINPEDYYKANDKASRKVADAEVVEEAEIKQQQATPNNGAQYNSLYYNDDNNQEITNAIESQNLSDFKSGIAAYNLSNYNKAIQKFESSIRAKKSINSSNYYIGMSYFNMNKHNKAINAFDKVIGTSSVFADDAIWYKALALINKGQKSKAKPILNSLIEMNSSYSNSALKKLNSI